MYIMFEYKILVNMNLFNFFCLEKQQNRFCLEKQQDPQSNQGFRKLESHPDQDLLLLSIFSHLRNQSDLFSVISVCRKWKNIGFDLWKAVPRRPELPNEIWTLIFSHLKIHELAMATILTKKANLLCETPWLLKAKESGFIGEKDNQKATKYLKDLFTVIIQLHKNNLIPGVLIQKLGPSLETLVLNGGIQRWPLDALITILKNKKAHNIPNLDLFVRYYYLYSCKVVENRAMSSRRLENDANWIDAALKILQKGENVNIPLSNVADTFPLQMAARKGQNGNVRALLCFTQNLNQCNKIGRTALNEAITCDNVKILSLLVEKGSDPTISYGNTPPPLVSAAMVNKIASAQFLLQLNDINKIENSFNLSPLHMAAFFGHEKMVSFLLKNGADPNQLFGSKVSPLSFALANKQEKTAQQLIPVCHVNKAMNEDWQPIHFAALFGLSKAVNLLLKHGADANSLTSQNQSPLIFALYNKHENVARQLIPVSHVNIVDNDHWTPLHHAAISGLVNSVKLLLKHGADANSLTSKNQSPLILALYNKHENVARQLIPVSHVNIVDIAGWTPLHHAAKSGLVNSVKLLLKQGADANSLTSQNQSPLILALRNMHDNIAMQLIPVSHVNVVDNDGWAPLHYAVENGFVKGVKLLLKRGADANLCLSDGRSPLHLAVIKNLPDIVALLLPFSNINAADNHGRTAADHATSKGFTEIADLLVANNIDVNILTQQDELPFVLAIKKYLKIFCITN